MENQNNHFVQLLSMFEGSEQANEILNKHKVLPDIMVVYQDRLQKQLAGINDVIIGTSSDTRIKALTSKFGPNSHPDSWKQLAKTLKILKFAHILSYIYYASSALLVETWEYYETILRHQYDEVLDDDTNESEMEISVEKENQLSAENPTSTTPIIIDDQPSNSSDPHVTVPNKPKSKVQTLWISKPTQESPEDKERK